MFGVLLLAAYLRIHDLNAQGMWGDEGWSLWLARGDTPGELVRTMITDKHGPANSLLLRGWWIVAGPAVVALRYLTVLFSIASIALIARLGRELVSPVAGVGAALAFTLMDKHVVLSQEVRHYPIAFFMMLLTACCYVCWWRAVHSPRGPAAVRGSAFGFVAATALGLYLHYYTYMVVIAILLHAAITLRGRDRWKHFLALNALGLLAFAPWLPVMLHQLIWTPVDEVVLTTYGMPLTWETVDYLARESFGTPVALYGLLMVLGFAAPFAGRFTSWRVPGPLGDVPPRKRITGVLLAGLWFAVPLAITLALHSRQPLLTDRNISVIMPAIALLVGVGFTVFERYGGAFVVALVLVNGLLTTSSYYDKPPWREMAADIAAYYPGDEPVLVEVEGAHAALWYHLALELPGDVRTSMNLLPAEAEGIDRAVSLFDLRARYGGEFVPRLQRIVAETDGLWLAYWGDPAKKHDVFDVLDLAGFQRTATLSYAHHDNPIFAYRYDRAGLRDATLAAFAESITLHRVAFPESVAQGADLPVLLWWSAEAPPPDDYSVSVIVMGGGRVINHDGYPANGNAPTSAWEPGALVFDPHILHLPGDLPPGTYDVRVKLYTWWDGAILPLADGVVPDSGVQVGTLTVR